MRLATHAAFTPATVRIIMNRQRLFIVFLALCAVTLLGMLTVLIWVATFSFPPVGHGN